MSLERITFINFMLLETMNEKDSEVYAKSRFLAISVHMKILGLLVNELIHLSVF